MDNDLDLLFSNYVGTCPLWLNNDSGSFDPLGQVFGSHQVLSLRCGDIDGNAIFLNESIKDK